MKSPVPSGARHVAGPVRVLSVAGAGGVGGLPFGPAAGRARFRPTAADTAFCRSGSARLATEVLEPGERGPLVASMNLSTESSCSLSSTQRMIFLGRMVWE